LKSDYNTLRKKSLLEKVKEEKKVKVPKEASAIATAKYKKEQEIKKVESLKNDIDRVKYGKEIVEDDSGNEVTIKITRSRAKEIYHKKYPNIPFSLINPLFDNIDDVVYDKNKDRIAEIIKARSETISKIKDKFKDIMENPSSLRLKKMIGKIEKGENASKVLQEEKIKAKDYIKKRDNREKDEEQSDKKAIPELEKMLKIEFPELEDKVRGTVAVDLVQRQRRKVNEQNKKRRVEIKRVKKEIDKLRARSYSATNEQIKIINEQIKKLKKRDITKRAVMPDSNKRAEENLSYIRRKSKQKKLEGLVGKKKAKELSRGEITGGRIDTEDEEGKVVRGDTVEGTSIEGLASKGDVQTGRDDLIERLAETRLKQDANKEKFKEVAQGKKTTDEIYQELNKFRLLEIEDKTPLQQFSPKAVQVARNKKQKEFNKAVAGLTGPEKASLKRYVNSKDITFKQALAIANNIKTSEIYAKEKGFSPTESKEVREMVWGGRKPLDARDEIIAKRESPKEQEKVAVNNDKQEIPDKKVAIKKQKSPDGSIKVKLLSIIKNPEYGFNKKEKIDLVKLVKTAGYEKTLAIAKKMARENIAGNTREVGGKGAVLAGLRQDKMREATASREKKMDIAADLENIKYEIAKYKLPNDINNEVLAGIKSGNLSYAQAQARYASKKESYEEFKNNIVPRYFAKGTPQYAQIINALQTSYTGAQNLFKNLHSQLKNKTKNKLATGQ